MNMLIHLGIGIIKKTPNTDFIIGSDDTNDGTITLCYTVKSGVTPLGLIIFELTTQYIKDILRNDSYSYYNIQISDNNELKFISKNIINMRDKNIILEKELTKKISELKKLQSAALQMQFSPYFLFNTLNAL